MKNNKSIKKSSGTNSVNNLIMIFAIVVVLVSLVNFGVTLIKISEYNKQITGFASGYVNITVNTRLEINLTQLVVNWSNGNVDAGQVNATLFTNQSSPGVVLRGNWTGASALAFVVQNVGNLNASLSVQAAKNATTLFAGRNGTDNQQYQWNVTNKEVGSCTFGNITLGAWNNVNVTSGGTKICGQLDYEDSRDEVYIDILLTVPNDATNTGILSDIITITANAAG